MRNLLEIFVGQLEKPPLFVELQLVVLCEAVEPDVYAGTPQVRLRDDGAVLDVMENVGGGDRRSSTFQDSRREIPIRPDATAGDDGNVDRPAHFAEKPQVVAPLRSVA